MIWSKHACGIHMHQCSVGICEKDEKRYIYIWTPSIYQNKNSISLISFNDSPFYSTNDDIKKDILVSEETFGLMVYSMYYRDEESSFQEILRYMATHKYMKAFKYRMA